MPQDKIYASLGIKHVYFSNVDMEYQADGKFLSCSNTATFWASEEWFRDVDVFYSRDFLKNVLQVGCLL